MAGTLCLWLQRQVFSLRKAQAEKDLCGGSVALSELTEAFLRIVLFRTDAGPSLGGRGEERTAAAAHVSAITCRKRSQSG